MDRLLCCCQKGRGFQRHREGDGPPGHPPSQSSQHHHYAAKAAADEVELPPYPQQKPRIAAVAAAVAAAEAASPRGAAAAAGAPPPSKVVVRPSTAPQPQQQQKQPTAPGDDDLIGLKEVVGASPSSSSPRASPSAAGGAAGGGVGSLRQHHHRPKGDTSSPAAVAPSSPALQAVSSPSATAASPTSARKAKKKQQQHQKQQDDDNQEAGEAADTISSPLTGAGFSSPAAATAPATVAPAKANWAEAWAPMVREQQQAEALEKERRAFLDALATGVVAIKHDRKGRSRLRELFSPDGGQSFSWRAPTGGGKGHQRGKSSGGGGGGGGLWERDRAVYAFHDILEVRRGTVPDPSTGGKEQGTDTLRASCPKSDMYKSFSLILKDRTVDFTCHSLEQMTFLVKGLSTLMAEQKRALIKARAAEAAAAASPRGSTAAY